MNASSILPALQVGHCANSVYLVEPLDLADFDECLHGAIRKLRRAEGLAEEVGQMCLHAARDNEALDLEYQQLNDRKEHVWRLRDSVFCDPQLPIVLGDAVHNYRTALDHLAWSLVKLAHFSPSNKTFFPVKEVEPREGRNNITIDERIQPTNPINAYVQSVQPFVTYLDSGYFAPIAQLHRLDLADKHRVLLVSVVALDYATFVNSDPQITANAHSYGGSLSPGSIVMRAYTTEPADLSEGKARLIVRLEDAHYRVDGDGNVIADAPQYRLDVVDFLNSVHPEVSEIIRGANPLFVARHAHTGPGEMSFFEKFSDGVWQGV
jgi:hypothetical protein